MGPPANDDDFDWLRQRVVEGFEEALARPL